jgi:integrase
MIAWKRAQFKWGREQAGTVSNATVNRAVIEPLKRLMKYAKENWDVAIPKEPKWANLWLDQEEERVRELDYEEDESIEAAVRDDYAPWLEFVRLSGLRRRETLLRWSNVNWSAKMITITGKGDRKVRTPITPAVEAILKSCMGDHPVYVFTFVAKRTTKNPQTGEVYVKGQRYPITKEGAKTHWRRLRIKSGVQDFRFHDLRHDTASKLLRHTGNLKLVQKTLNHKDIKSTLRYAHVLNEDVAKGLDSFAKSRIESRKNLRKTGKRST